MAETLCTSWRCWLITRNFRQGKTLGALVPTSTLMRDMKGVGKKKKKKTLPNYQNRNVTAPARQTLLIDLVVESRLTRTWQQSPTVGLLFLVYCFKNNAVFSCSLFFAPTLLIYFSLIFIRLEQWKQYKISIMRSIAYFKRGQSEAAAYLVEPPSWHLMEYHNWRT